MTCHDCSTDFFDWLIFFFGGVHAKCSRWFILIDNLMSSEFMMGIIYIIATIRDMRDIVGYDGI